MRAPAGVPVESVVSRAYDLLLENDPSAQLWAVGLPLEGEGDRERAGDLIHKFVAAQGEGAAVVTFDLEADVNGQPEFPGVLLDLHRLFLPTYTRVTGTGAVLEASADAGSRAVQGVTSYSFFDAESFQGLIGFFARPPV